MALDVLSMLGLMAGLTAFQELKLEWLGRASLGIYMLHTHFVRKVDLCEELVGHREAVQPCRSIVMFGGLWLDGFEVIPTPAAALQRWQLAAGHGLLQDLGGEVLLWAYPVLFALTFGLLFQQALEKFSSVPPWLAGKWQVATTAAAHAVEGIKALVNPPVKHNGKAGLKPRRVFRIV